MAIHYEHYSVNVTQGDSVTLNDISMTVMSHLTGFEVVTLSKCMCTGCVEKSMKITLAPDDYGFN